MATPTWTHFVINQSASGTKRPEEKWNFWNVVIMVAFQRTDGGSGVRTGRGSQTEPEPGAAEPGPAGSGSEASVWVLQDFQEFTRTSWRHQDATSAVEKETNGVGEEVACVCVRVRARANRPVQEN